MGKWIAIGAVALVGFAVFLLLELGADGEPATKVAAAADRPLTEAIAPAVKLPVLPDLDPPKPTDGPKKLDPQSDEFFYQFDEMVPKKLTMAAAECYKGGLDRNQHLKLGFDNVIKNGVVSVRNLKILDSSFGDPVLEQCMVRKVAEVTWKNDALPDGVWGDQLKITPERGMKKYLKEQMEYEGDPNGLPVGKAVMKPGQAPPPSDTATRSGFEAAAEAGR